MKTYNLELLNFYKYIQSYCFELPKNIKPIQTYEGQVLNNLEDFFEKFYIDSIPRNLILGINPGRKGAGVTGIPFTDSKRLSNLLNKDSDLGPHSYEPSAAFFYRVVDAYGGAKAFYSDFLVSSVSPIGFLRLNSKNNWVNYNYYDDSDLYKICKPFIVQSMERLLSLSVNTRKVLCLGSGKNYKILKQLNQEYCWFGQVMPIEHPRYIMQYKSKDIDYFINKYNASLSEIKKSQLKS
jgi:hypothetical protein